MGRISGQAQNLHRLLVRHGYDSELEGSFDVPRPRLDELPDHLAAQAVALYRALAGATAVAGEMPTFRPDRWDLRVDGVLLELDETRHFNRYRALTLETLAYAELAGFPLHPYKAYCVEHEQDCLRSAAHGGYWTNPSCGAMFGPSGPPGDLSGLGSPRWKQRAFYDYLKDLSPLCSRGPATRLSVWDELPGTAGAVLGSTLERDSLERAAAVGVMRLIGARTP